MAFPLVEEIICKRLLFYKSGMNKITGSHWKFENKITKSHCSFNNKKLHTYFAFDFLYAFPTCKLVQRNVYCTHDLIRKYNTVDSGSSKASKVSVTHIKELLASHNIEFEDGFTCLITKCPVCNTPQEDVLFINKTTGFFACRNCKNSGQWDALEKRLTTQHKLDKSKPVTFHLQTKHKSLIEATEKWKTICSASESMSSLTDEKREDVCRQFNSEVLSKTAADQLGAQVDKNESVLYFPLKNGDDVIGYKTLTIKGTESTVPKSGCQGLLIFKAAALKRKKKREGVLVHNIKDMLSLVNTDVPYDIICLPHGIENLPQDVLPLLENYRKLILWFGDERHYWEAAREFAKKLVENRCYIIRPGVVRENNNIADVLSKAAPIQHSSITNFAALRQNVFTDLQNSEKADGIKWQRFPTLNVLLRGHRKGELTVLTGPTGSGKTTFMSEYSLDLALQGVTTLWGSFEIRNERLARTMLQQYVQAPLTQNMDKFNSWADRFEQLPMFFLTFHGQQPLKTVMEAVEHALFVHDISHVVIDNVQFMLGMSSSSNHASDRFYKQDRIIATFRDFATSRNCHVTLVIHPRKEKYSELLTVNSIFGGAKASQEADNILIIQQKTLQSLKLKTFLQVAKNRYSGDLGVMPLEFDKESLSFAHKKTKKEKESKST